MAVSIAIVCGRMEPTVFDGNTVLPREVLINSGQMSLQFKAAGFKAKIASNSKAIAKSFNVETDSFECKITGHELMSTFFI